MKVVALVFIRKDDLLLLVKQDYGERFWSLPGGLMEPGESIAEVAIREVREETGLEIRITKLVGVYSKPLEDSVALTFSGEVLGGELRPDSEISACSYFPLQTLPAHMRGHFEERLIDYLKEQPEAFVRTQ